MNALWAVGYPVTAIALHSGASPSLLSAIRLVVAFLLLSPLLLHLKRWSWSLLGLAAFMGIIGFAVPVWLQIIGLRSTNPAIASISVAVEPLLTILLAALFRKAHLSWRHQIALILALGGSWILLGEPRPGHAGHLGGDLALFLAIFCFALYNIVSPALANRVDPAPGSALVFGFGALGSTVLWMLQGSSLPAHLTTTFVWSSGFLAIGATGLAYLLWLWVVNRQSLTVVSLFLYTQPLLGSLLSWMLGQSPLTLSLVSGGLLILLAMTLSQMDILPTAKAN
ncbi:MAG: EamA/RhaT family transporter [Sulfobacillus acidophilus]|uniref:EamA/RhaT family transporter n=1 Tax=Sulfobacillus acidophilus TaxID=53633 RepID=A0A2T2WLF8_9FIRM|nr:MAG: EamA/RhaT family transporter [Sulfobacillus acidophilus]